MQNKLANNDYSYPHHQFILEKAEAFAPIKVAAVHPVDCLSLKSAIDTANSNIIKIILVGSKEKINKAAEDNDINIDGFEIIDTMHSHAAADKAVELARAGEVDAIMKGKIHTDELMYAVLNKQVGLYGGKRLSHVAIVDIPNFPRPIFISDAALNICPDLTDKIDIIQNAVNLFKSLYKRKPKVAILSAVETVTENIPSTIDATALCKMSERGQITNAILDGPLAFDTAISLESTNIKEIKSEVAGNADILIAPNLEAGNILLKELILMSNARMAGVVLGGKIPIILTSRSSSLASRKVSCALASIAINSKP